MQNIDGYHLPSVCGHKGHTIHYFYSFANHANSEKTETRMTLSRFLLSVLDQKKHNIAHSVCLKMICMQASGSSSIAVGSRVRVRTGVEPSTGWGSVKAGSVGVVTEMRNEGVKCQVTFPEQTGWIGVVAEMELVPDPAITTGA